jgi:parallel beta-helix repeat protein
MRDRVLVLLLVSALGCSGGGGGSSGGGGGVTSAPSTSSWPPAAPDTDYYIAQSLGASDSNDGVSPIASGTHGPWLTIGRAAAVVVRGDVIHVAPGTYAEDVTIGSSGTASAPIVFQGDASSPPVVGSFTVSGAAFVEIQGFTIVGPKSLPGNWTDMPAVVVDDPSIAIDQGVPWTGGRQAAALQKYASYTNAVENVFNGPGYSLFTAGIRIDGSTNVTVSRCSVSLHTIGIATDKGSSLVTIDANEAFHCTVGVWNGSSGSPPVSASTISNNHCHQNLLHGIEVRSSADSITVSNNLCEYNSLCQIAVEAGASNCLVRNNTCQFGGYYAETMESPGPSAVDFFGAGPGCVADGNYAAFEVDPTLRDGGGFTADSSPNPVVFTNNVSYRNEGHGITLARTSGNRVVNNTLVENGFQTTSATAGAGLGIGSSSTGNTIENNIFSGNGSAHVTADAGLASQLLDYNLYAPGIPFVRGPNGSYATITSLHAIGCESHGIGASAGFVSATDFHPGSGSPAIGKGNSVIAPPIDFYGTVRSGPADMGAIEH